MTLFPNKLNDDYKGSRLAIYGLYPIFALYIFRSLVHFLSENAGLVGIATIKDGLIDRRRAEGKLVNLKDKISDSPLAGI